MRKQKILGLDLGSNSLGWALFDSKNGKAVNLIDAGARIFNKAVEDTKPTPKNVTRRNKRLARRVNQRRARRKQRMLNYLIKLNLLPPELKSNNQPEITLNSLGDPYQLRAKALDHPLSNYQFGRVMLHMVQRRGFLSNRKTLIGDMIDDPDVMTVLEELEHQGGSTESDKEETKFKKEISELRAAISENECRSLGEYLASLDLHAVKRNRVRDGGTLRTDRQMYRDEFDLIWTTQARENKTLTDNVKEQFEEIIFKQRPIKLRADRVGKCSLEPKKNRARLARLEVQKFRYLQDINNLQYLHPHTEKQTGLAEDERQQLIRLFEEDPKPTLTKIKKIIGLGNRIKLNLEAKNIKPNVTACTIRKVLPQWDEMRDEQQYSLVEDLLTIQKKSVLKQRLMNHWEFPTEIAVYLSLIEFENGHSNLSTKAINKLLPFLLEGQIYSDARVSAGYGYEETEIEALEKLPVPPETSNPIVNKGLHELRRVVNAIIKHYGTPDIVRLEMARDLEMNTKRYKLAMEQQRKNEKANIEAAEKYCSMRQENPHLNLSNYPSRDDKIRYRLWKDQEGRCAYSQVCIPMAQLFSAEVDVDHIVPYSQSLDDSYMNKVVCRASENRYKSQRTPINAFVGNKDKWTQITQSLRVWENNKQLRAKANRFYMTDEDIVNRDFISSQLNDTRYISRLAIGYLKQLGCDVTTTKGFIVSWLRKQWCLNRLLHEIDEKNRNDHRHHAIDAMVIACIDRGFHKRLADIARHVEQQSTELNVRDIHIDEPWATLKDDFKEKVNKIIVSHASQRKVSGELHEATGAGFIKGIGTVYRVDLNSEFKLTKIKDIIDDEVRALVASHLAKYDMKPKQAFAEGVAVLHKNGRTPIKRVRVRQSKITLDKLQKSKFGAKNKRGEVFRWMAYGNFHHVELIRDKNSGKVIGKFVTAMKASHRAKGVGLSKPPIIKKDHGKEYEFIMALHINDLVTIKNGEAIKYYRVQKLESPSRIRFREHNAATLKNSDQEKRLTVNADLLDVHGLRKIELNSLGKAF